MQPISWLIVASLAYLSVFPAWVVSRQLSEGPTASKYVFVVLGDSLSDSGNTFRTAGIPDPAVYYQGRFSNGPVWYDYLLEQYASSSQIKFYNYATGGSCACYSNTIQWKYPFVRDLDNQTAAFVADVRAGRVVVEPDATLVVLQWIGANDFINVMNKAAAEHRPPTPAELVATAQAVVQCRLASLQALVAALPGRAMQLAFLPTTPMSIAPLVPAALKPQFQQLEAVMGTAGYNGVRQLCRAFTAARPGQVGHGVHVHNIGISNRWLAGLMGQVRPKFKNTTASCFRSPVSSLVITPNTTTCSHPDDFAFFDLVHPTTNYHKWMALYGLGPRLKAIGLLP